jgi:mutator protein MutT
MDLKEVYNDDTIKIERSEHSWHLWVRSAVATLLVQNGKIILIEDKKTVNDHWLWNCPGGMIANGETAEQAARRESEEETGIIPAKLEKFATIKTDFPDTYVDYFIGYDLKPGKKAPWVESKLEDTGNTKGFTWQELYEFAINNQLRDPRLVVAILQLSKNEALLRSHGLII